MRISWNLAQFVLIAVPIVLGIALVALALAYDNGIQLRVGIATLTVGLLAEGYRNLYL